MDLRYNPEKRIRQNLDPKHTLSKHTPRIFAQKSDPEKRSHLTLDSKSYLEKRPRLTLTPKHTLSKRTPQNLTKKAILKNIPHKSLP